MLEEGLWAEVIVGKEHLRLFSERTPSGVQASVYNVTGKLWIAPSESVEDINEGKDRAQRYASAFLRCVATGSVPRYAEY